MRLRMLARGGHLVVYLGAGFLVAAGLWFLSSNGASNGPTHLQNMQYRRDPQQVPDLLNGQQNKLPNTTINPPPRLPAPSLQFEV